MVSKEIQEIVHEAAPDDQPMLSPIPEIRIGIGKSENRVVFLDGLSLQASMERQTMSMTEISPLSKGSRLSYGLDGGLLLTQLLEVSLLTS